MREFEGPEGEEMLIDRKELADALRCGDVKTVIDMLTVRSEEAGTDDRRSYMQTELLIETVALLVVRSVSSPQTLPLADALRDIRTGIRHG
jgi:hypothetical protein